MFTNLSQRLNSTLAYLKPTADGESSEPASDQLYKIPSTPLKSTKNSLILTRSQCDNTCSANCLVHKRRKRKAKAADTSSDLSLVSTESADHLDESTKATTSRSTTMPPSKRRPSPKSTKYSNHHAVFSDDDEGIDEDEVPEAVERNYVNRYNYYENFKNLNEVRRTIAANPTVRSSFYPVLIGLLCVLLTGVFLWSTSQQLSHNITGPENRLLNTVEGLGEQSNPRAIESFKQELQQSFAKLHQRIDRIETELQAHRQTQAQLNARLDRLDSKLEPYTKQIDQIATELGSYKVQINQMAGEFSPGSDCKLDDCHQLIKEALATYDADKTGIVDYASEFAGGEIVSTGCTESYDLKGASYRILGLPIWSPPNIPRFVIQPNSSPGQCWYFRGNKGSLVIKLSRSILPESFSYEHIPVRNAPDGHINSAPKHFEVRGLDGENADDNWLLGEFDYDKRGDPIQFFRFANTDRPVEYIEFNVLDNHGNEEFTCMYRIRVHGVKVDKEE